jgi:hypothetical protein
LKNIEIPGKGKQVFKFQSNINKKKYLWIYHCILKPYIKNNYEHLQQLFTSLYLSTYMYM